MTKKTTILIVENDAILALDLQGMISRLGYAVAGPLASGEDALAFSQDTQVDLVLMDIELAGALNGIDTAEILHRSSGVPIVFLTGFSQDPLLEKAKIAAPYGYLIKPVPERELAAMLEMALHRHRLDRELKESKIALGKSEERLLMALEAAHSGMWEWNLETNENIWSEGLWRLYGLDPKTCEASYDTWRQVIHPEDRSRVEKIVQKAVAGKSQLNAEWRVMLEDGTYRWLMSRGKPILDQNGQATHYLGIVIDITGKRLAEDNYRILFHEMLSGFALHQVICNSEGEPVNYRFLAVNPAFERMTGLKAGDIIGRTVLEIIPDIESHWIETYGKVALTGEPVHFENYSASLAKHFEITAFRPAVKQFACIFVDITDRKRGEQERNMLKDRLRQVEKMEAIGTLAGGIAHDFNNILGAILGYAEIALEDSPEGSIVASDVAQIVKAGHRAKELVTQILAFSRQIEAEKIPLQPSAIIKETVKMLRSTLPSTIAIQVDVDKSAATILADPTQFQQILINLCTNAFHAMEETGGVLKISLRSKIFSREDLASEPAVQPGNFVQLSVGDTGSGISPEIRDKIFDPFFTTKEIGKGTGMGLSITHGIVKSYGGFVTCQSKPGKGTTFHVLLPTIGDIAQRENDSHDLIQPGNEHILYVDDEALLADMGKSMLERLGYRVTVKTSSVEALATFRNHPDDFDLIITDQTMPEITGKDLARRMLQIKPSLPIILCTGFSNHISEETAMSFGIRGFAMKPLTKRNLATLVRKVLDECEN